MTLLAGAASADLTPAKPLQLFGYPHVPRVTATVHDPIQVNALYLDHGETRAVLVSLDLLMLEPPFARELRAAVAALAGAPEAQVFIGCTHTHSAPVTAGILGWSGNAGAPPPDPDYLARVHDRTLAAVAAARRNAVPATLTWDAANAAGIGGNRLEPDGPADLEAGVLAVRDVAGRLLAVLITCAMHPTVIHEDTLAISADFPGSARAFLQRTFGNRLTVLHFTAPCGNQSPRYVVRGQTFAEAERLGEILGMGVVTTLASMPPAAADALVLAGVCREVELPLQPLAGATVAAQRLADARARFAELQGAGAPHGPLRTAECAVFGAEGAVELAKAAADGRLDAWLAAARPAVQALRVGGATLVGLPGECFVEYGLALKAHAPGRLFPVSLVNGHLQGYVVTPEAAAAGGYEASNSLYAPAAGDVLVRTGCELFEQLNPN